MYGLYLAFDWLAHHLVWTALGVFVVGGTFAIVWMVERNR